MWWRSPIKEEKEHINYKVDENDEASMYFDEAHKSKKQVYSIRQGNLLNLEIRG